jgi:hypothetical protein
MTPAESSGPLRTFGFGTLQQDTLLAGWFPAPGTEGVLLVASGATVQARTAQLSADAARGEWRVSADGAQLLIAPTSQPAALSSSEGEVAGYEQGAEISGQLAAGGGEELSLALPGRRGERPEAGELAGLDSVRELAAWFGPSEAIAVIALRPRKHKGQEQDRIQAAVVDPEAAVLIVDPRLSTTFTAAGRASRVGLELWSEDEEQPPLRVAGEALARGARLSAPGWELTVDWLACHRRGRDGAGVYLLARPA